MITSLKRLWRTAPWPTAVLALSVVVAAIFAVRLIAHSVYWNDPRHHAQDVEGWMTPGYIARSWDMPRKAFMEAIDVPQKPKDGKPYTLSQLAEMQGVPEAELIAQAQATVEAFAAQRQVDHD